MTSKTFETDLTQQKVTSYVLWSLFWEDILGHSVVVLLQDCVDDPRPNQRSCNDGSIEVEYHQINGFRFELTL